MLVLTSSITLLLSSVVLIAAPVLATPGNNGTVKIHEGASEDEPIVANDPHVCTFHLHFFFGDDVQSGDWWIEEWAPGEDKGEVVLDGSYDATEGEDRQPAAPSVYELPDGHYKLFWEGATNPGGQLNIKHKVFWVSCEQETDTTPTPTPTPKEEDDEEEEDNAALNIRKVDEEGNRLEGAVFTVEGMDGTFTTNDRGFFCITGLENDSEWLVTEIEAPDGYEIADEPSQMVEVDDDGDCNSPDAVFVNTLAEEEPTEEPTATPTEEPTEEPTVTNPSPTPREDTAGGNPTPKPRGGTLPDTAVSEGSSLPIPAGLAALVALASLSVLAGVRFAEVRSRR